MQTLTILGSTGSIGQQTLAVLRRYPHKFRVLGLANHSNHQLLTRQIREFTPRFVATQAPVKLRRTKLCTLHELSQKKVDLVVNGISGSNGILPTLTALENGSNVALANKEALVIAGPFLRRAARRRGTRLLPVDSEHAALYQLLKNRPKTEIHQIILTASGGALRNLPLSKLAKVTPAQVLRHPTWQMGAKITVDCSTLANKAFEVIEAAELFELPLAKIKVLLHPQSLVHALIELKTGETLAAAATPDMRLPIGNALFNFATPPHPHLKFLDLTGKRLEFYPLKEKRYPLFHTILRAAKQGLYQRAIATFAAETAVSKFLKQEIPYPAIPKFVVNALQKIPFQKATLKNILNLKTEIKRRL